MRLPSPDPRQLRDLASIASGGVRAGRELLSLVPRLEGLLDAAELLVERLAVLVARLEEGEARARAVIEQVDEDQRRAQGVIAEIEAVTARLCTSADSWAPMLRRVEPALARLCQTWGPAEVDALTRAVHGGSRVSDQLGDEVIPVVETLKSVAPDLTELVTTSKALNEIIGTVPGLGRAKKRAEEEIADADVAKDADARD